MTPHLECKKEDVAPIVIMPGDPLRAKFIANNFLEDVKEVNHLRGALGYTGYYKGKRVTVQASGMGIPSMGIYCYELYKFYDVQAIIRVGSFGAYTEYIDLYDLVLAENSYSEAHFAVEQNGNTDKVVNGSENLNNLILKTAEETNTPIKYAPIHCSEAFYKEENKFRDIYTEYGCVGCEMESFALFHVAKLLGRDAACILTCSDNLVTKLETTPAERQNSFTKMIELALNTALKL